MTVAKNTDLSEVKRIQQKLKNGVFGSVNTVSLKSARCRICIASLLSENSITKSIIEVIIDLVLSPVDYCLELYYGLQIFLLRKTPENKELYCAFDL